MPPKKKPSRQNVRAGPGTTVANAIPEKLRGPGVRQETEHILQHHVNKRNLAKNPLRLSPLTVSHETYFNPREDGKVTIKNDTTPGRSLLHLSTKAPLTVDAYNPPSFVAYRGLRGPKIPPGVRLTSPLTYPDNYPGKTGTGVQAAKTAEAALARIPPRKYIGGKKTRRKKKRTRTRKRKRTRKKKNRKRRRTKKKRRRRR